MPTGGNIRSAGLAVPRTILRSLFLKLVLGTLTVLALVLVPTLLVVRHRIETEVQEAMRYELATQCQALARRLAEVPPERAPARIRDITQLVPVRVTVIDTSGVVLGDSHAPADTMDNHLARPEVREALLRGHGSAIRDSSTLGQTMIYAASRYPLTGPPAGVVRLALPAARAEEAAARTLDFIDTVAAAAATAAVLLSFAVALLLTRGLRQIRRGALALAQGDLSYPVAVKSRDEIGEVGAALAILARELRGRLLEAGADRSTLRALLDELPVGVIVCGRDGSPQALNGAARTLLDLAPASELEGARALIAAPAHAEVARRVLETRLTEEQVLEQTSRDGRSLRGRWVAVGREDGGAELVLILWDDVVQQWRSIEQDMVTWADALRAAVPKVVNPVVADDIGKVLERMDRARASILPTPDQIAPTRLASLCEPVTKVARARAAADRITLELDLATPDTVVVEANGRVEAALRRMLKEALDASRPGDDLRLRSQDSPTAVRLSLRVRSAAIKTKWMNSQVAALGGSAGADRDGDDVELWLNLPRA